MQNLIEIILLEGIWVEWNILGECLDPIRRYTADS
jgi:hypothetical protein